MPLGAVCKVHGNVGHIRRLQATFFPTRRTMKQNKVLEPHQEEGVAWCISREQDEDGPHGGFLCDEMGLGKTIQMCALTNMHPADGPTLVCCMLNNCKHWIQEFKDYADIDVFDPPRNFSGIIPKDVKVVVVPYSLLQRNPSKWVFKTEWGRLIMDEGHIACNPKTKLYQALSKIPSTRRWVLSATPMQNKQSDMINIATGLLKLDVSSIGAILETYYLRRTSEADQTVLPTLNAFVQILEFEYEEERVLYDLVEAYYKRVMIDMGGKGRNYTARIMEGIIRLRQICSHPQLFFTGALAGGNKKRKRERESQMVSVSGDQSAGNQELNDVFDAWANEELNSAQAESNEGAAKQEVDDILEMLEQDLQWKVISASQSLHDDGGAAERERKRIETKAIKTYLEGLHSMKDVPVQDMRSLINGIDEIPPLEYIRSSKMKWLLSDICANVESEKIVVFFSFVEELKLLEKALGERDVSTVKYEGSMAREDKEKAVMLFNQTNVRVFLMQIKCGGVGLNLQAASRLYITCPSYNPCVDIQAVGRVFRKGQTRPVTAIRLIMKDTVEGRCLEISENKLSTIRNALGENTGMVLKGTLKKTDAEFIMGK